MMLLKMDPHRFKETLEIKNYCYTHEFKHRGMLMKFQWNSKGGLKYEPGGGGWSYHAACAARHLETHFNASGRLLIQQLLIEKVIKELNMKKMIQ